MAFDNKGFLSTRMISWTAAARIKYESHFGIAENLNTQCMKALTQGNYKTNSPAVVPALVFARAVQTFQGAILLSEKGMIADARTLVRSCTEAAIAIGNLAINPAFLENMLSSKIRSQGPLAKLSLARLNTVSDSSSKAQKVQFYEDAIREYDENKEPSVNWESAAKKAQFEGIYDAIYRTTSSDGAHVTLDALSRHLDDSGPTINIEFGPSEKDLEQTVILAIGAIAHCLMAFGKATNETILETQGAEAVRLSGEMMSTAIAKSDSNNPKPMLR